MTDRASGILAMLAACTTWGLSPLFYNLLLHVPAAEVLSHRVLWSFVIFFALVLLRGSLPTLLALMTPGRQIWAVIGASLMIATNWLLFIWSVQSGRVLETSLGYFIYPLVSVALGFWVLGEQLKRTQWLAVGLAALAVVVLTWRLGTLPWVSLTLGVTFGIYGLLKKRLAAGPIASVTAEAALILPIAVIWLAGVHLAGWGGTEAKPPAVFGHDQVASVLLVLSGVITAGPLVLISYAAHRLPLATVGVLTYVNPSLQFLCAVLILGETLTASHAIAFGLIWTALAIYSVSEWRRPSPPQPAVPQPNPPA